MPMVVQGTFNKTHFHFQTISPVTLDPYWPKSAKLIAVVVLSIIGTLANGFYIGSFFIDPNLKKPGNVFLACLGLADLLVSSIVFPLSAIALISDGEYDTPATCRIQYFFVTSATYLYSLCSAFVAIELYYRMRCRASYDSCFTLTRILIIAWMIITTSFGFAAYGVWGKVDIDYCELDNLLGDFFYRVLTAGAFFLVPAVVAMHFNLKSLLRVFFLTQGPHYRRSQLYRQDRAQIFFNIVSHLLFLGLWVPYMLVVHVYHDVKPRMLIYSSLFGILRPIFASMTYVLISKSFRKSFGRQYRYLCCKSSISNNYHRHRRGAGYAIPGEVRVHIMHQGKLSTIGNQRGQSSSRDVQEL